MSLFDGKVVEYAIENNVLVVREWQTDMVQTDNRISGTGARTLLRELKFSPFEIWEKDEADD
jgi:hypothetical protein